MVFSTWVRIRQAGFWNIAATAAWGLVLLALVIRIACWQGRAGGFRTYEVAGLQWVRGEYLYGDWRGFVYGPLAAALFSPLAFLPPGVSHILWTAVNFAALVGGIGSIVGLYPNLERKNYGIPFLLLLPLALGNLDIGQANPLIIGLLMLALGAVHRERWGIAALCVAFATYFKIYPLAFGLLIAVIAPRRFGWRLLLALGLFGLMPFLLQRWGYVFSQYQGWFVTRLTDNRLNYPLKSAPLDLWLLLVRFGRLNISSRLYSALQVLSGAAIAVYCVVGSRRGWLRARVLIGLFSFVSIWMTLCGPATESQTYLLLGPAVDLALVQAMVEPRPVWLRACVGCAFALLLLAVARSMFAPGFKELWVLAAQPVAAVIFLVYCLWWLLDDSQWPSTASRRIANSE
ncbi:MAG: glycosyltransferase family 87 protein [Chthoniobacterales bacterium]